MSNQQAKPWLNEDGSVKSEEEIKNICQAWGPSVWNEYLESLEVSQKEDSVFSPSIMDTFSAEECAGLVFSMASEEKYPLLKVALNACIRQLSPKQREIIHQYYWNGKTLHEIASEMGITRQSVYKSMKAARLKLKALLTSGSIQKRIVAAKEMLAS